jgi:ketosteroid isomerase-like protein
MSHLLRVVSLSLSAVVLLTSAACRRGEADTPVSDLESLRATDRALQQAIAAKDLERTVSFYAADASVLPVAEPIVTGADAIRKEWAHIFAIPGFKSTSTLTKSDVASGEQLAYTQGSYETELETKDGKIATERGKFVSVWKKQADGSWKIVADIYNTDAPPPVHK